MPVLRFDATTHDWVIFAPERGQRPRELDVGPPASSTLASCPFCPGREMAGDETFRLPDGKGGWKVRIIRNRFPALVRNDRTGHRGSDLFQEKGGYGSHEVLIESPEHGTALGDQPLQQVEEVLKGLRDRSRVLAEDPTLAFILAFKNHGEGAGTSMRHPHWQMVAMPVVPRRHRLRHIVAEDYFNRNGRCLYCDLLEGELAEGARIVAANAGFVALSPYASYLPFQVRILPRRHAASFLLVPDLDLPDLAAILRTVLRRLDGALKDPAFNLALNSAPLGDERKQYFMWHIDVLPRLSTPAGFELGSGMSINSVLPEKAAKVLREFAEPDSGGP